MNASRESFSARQQSLSGATLASAAAGNSHHGRDRQSSIPPLTALPGISLRMAAQERAGRNAGSLRAAPAVAEGANP